jgi:hypothetical protein
MTIARDAQKRFLTESQQLLGLGPTAMAEALDTNWNTYKAWLYGINPMPGAAAVAIRLMLEKKAEKDCQTA